MTLIDEATLDRYRGWQTCELCNVRRWCVPHHVHARGMGGGGRLDVDCNLVAVCHGCHTDIHQGIMGRAEVLQAVAKRMKLNVAEVEQTVWDLRRAKK